MRAQVRALCVVVRPEQRAVGAVWQVEVPGEVAQLVEVDEQAAWG